MPHTTVAPRPRRTVTTLTSALAALALLAGCGSGPGGGDAASSAAVATPEPMPMSVRDAGTMMEIPNAKEEPALRAWVVLDTTGEIRAAVETDGGEGVTDRARMSVTPEGREADGPLAGEFVREGGYLAAKPAAPLTPPVTVQVWLSVDDVAEGTATVTLEKAELTK